MNHNGHTLRRRRVVDYAAASVTEMEQYCVEHPGSPSAVRRPQLSFRGDLWIALLGPNVEEGIVGIGSTIRAALRAFDTQYLAGQCSPNETISSAIKPRRSYTVQLRRLPEC
ncbi:MAG TPA: hypothetical protein VGI59_03245 [Candidatus Udaeobacter sp.]|jgi:hypothetical protein